MTENGASSIAFIIVILLLMGLFVPGLVRYFRHKSRLQSAEKMQEAIIHVANECAKKNKKSKKTTENRSFSPGMHAANEKSNTFNAHESRLNGRVDDATLQRWRRSRLRGARIGLTLCLCALLCAACSVGVWYFAGLSTVVYLIAGCVLIFGGIGLFIIIRVNLVYAAKKANVAMRHSEFK